VAIAGSALLFVGSLIGPPIIAYNAWTFLDRVIGSGRDMVGLLIPLAIGDVALFYSIAKLPMWVRIPFAITYFVVMGGFLFALGAMWACGHGRGCL